MIIKNIDSLRKQFEKSILPHSSIGKYFLNNDQKNIVQEVSNIIQKGIKIKVC